MKILMLTDWKGRGGAAIAADRSSDAGWLTVAMKLNGQRRTQNFTSPTSTNTPTPL